MSKRKFHHIGSCSETRFNTEIILPLLCQVINDLYIGRGNPVPTNGSTHHLSIDRTLR